MIDYSIYDIFVIAIPTRLLRSFSDYCYVICSGGEGESFQKTTLLAGTIDDYARSISIILNDVLAFNCMKYIDVNSYSAL